MRPLAALTGVVLGLCVLLVAHPDSDRAAALSAYRIGDPVFLPVLQDPDGRAVDLRGLQSAASTSALVIEFWSARCPITRGYEAKLEALRAAYAGRGVKVVAVTACPGETRAEIGAARARSPSTVELLVDPAGRLAEQMGATKTPHFVIVDHRGQLAYSGALDSNLVGDGAVRHLRDALEAVLAGREAPRPLTRTFGSPIRRPAPTS